MHCGWRNFVTVQRRECEQYQAPETLLWNRFGGFYKFRCSVGPIIRLINQNYRVAKSEAACDDDHMQVIMK